MRFSCDSCNAQYMISDEKVGPNGVKVRCKKCGNVIPVRRTGEAEAGGAAGTVTPVPVTLTTDAARSEAALLGAAPVNAVARSEISSEWYVAIDDRQVGPLAGAAVRTRWDAGEIGPDTLAWRAGMPDWAPVSAIPDLARQLSAPEQRASEAAFKNGHAPNGVSSGVANGVSNGAGKAVANGASPVALNGKMNGQDVVWQPSAGNALAALASQELNAIDRPAAPAKAAATPAAEAPKTGASLLDRMNLPEGGVDPTHLVPLPMKGVERTTEVVLKPKATVTEHEPTQIRQLRKTERRSGIAWGVAVASLAAVVIAGGFWLYHVTQSEGSAPVAPVARVAPTPAQPAPAAPAAPAPAEKAPVAAAPAAPAPTPAAPPPAAVAAAPEPSTPPPAPQATPAAATVEPRAAPEPVAAAPKAAEPSAAARKRLAKAEAAAAAKRKPAPSTRATAVERVLPPSSTEAKRASATAAPAAAPVAEAPRKKSGDPLLDVGGDDELERELSSNKPKRNVYVPPAIGSDVADSVSVSQINEAVVGQKAALLRCIEEQRAVDPSARGTLKMRWIISGDGSTRDVRVASDEFAKQPIAPCITNVVKGIRFPRSRTTGQEVVFPFKF